MTDCIITSKSSLMLSCGVVVTHATPEVDSIFASLNPMAPSLLAEDGRFLWRNSEEEEEEVVVVVASTTETSAGTDSRNHVLFSSRKTTYNYINPSPQTGSF